MSYKKSVIEGIERTKPMPYIKDSVFADDAELDRYRTTNKTQYAGQIIGTEEGKARVLDPDGNAVNLNPELEEDITVLGTDFGNIKRGTTLSKGTTFTELMQQALVVASKGTLSVDPNGTVEVGTGYSDFVATFNKNQSGDATLLTLMVEHDGAESGILQSAFSSNKATIPAATIEEQDDQYKYFREGVTKFTATANYAASSFFEAGEVSVSRSITAKYRYYYGSSTNADDTTPIKGMGPTNPLFVGTGVSGASVVAGWKLIRIAIPTDKITASLSIQLATTPGNLVNDFTRSAIKVQDAAGNNVDYTLFTLKTAVANDADKLTITF